MASIERILKKETLMREDIEDLLSLRDTEAIRRLFSKAYEIKRSYVGNVVYLRGIIELSNICGNDCHYCGIRKGNHGLERYRMSVEEIGAAAESAWQWGYGSVVLQAGEVRTGRFMAFIEECIVEIRTRTRGELGITLSLGEQEEETYRRWFAAGAHRYLLRIETSNRELYETIHPRHQSFDDRLQCLAMLKTIGYIVGTGVMIGLPGQTIGDLAEDVLFFKTIDADMIGMGPYIPHRDTPLAGSIPDFDMVMEERFMLGLKMIAVTRMVLKDVNIASTTALQALHGSGREQGLLAGANVIMPNMTDARFKAGYQLYNGKPDLDENAAGCRERLKQKIASIGETIGYFQRGDSPHFQKRKK